MTPFSYLILRVVPSVERGECFNVGVAVFCRQQRFLGVMIDLDARRLAVLAPGIPAPDVVEHLTALTRIAEGAPGAGPIAALEQSERFGWLAAPSSTIVQPSAVHTGLCEDPAGTLRALFDRLVSAPAPAAA